MTDTRIEATAAVAATGTELEERLTTASGWENYWKEKPVVQVHEIYGLSGILDSQVKKLAEGSTSIELGGFPGYYSIHLRKNRGLRPALIDFVHDAEFFSRIMAANGLKDGDVRCITGDVLSCDLQERFDLVFSLGLIEHFRNLEEILKAHVRLMKKDGRLVIGVPNFRGVNGLVQFLFDRTNLDKHNLKAMDKSRIASLLEGLGLQDVKSFYVPCTAIWIENQDERTFANTAIRFTRRMMPILARWIGSRNRIVSCYMYWTATRREE